MGVTGLLNIPTADMQVDGTFMVGANYLPEQMLPDFWDYNSGNYFPECDFSALPGGRLSLYVDET